MTEQDEITRLNRLDAAVRRGSHDELSVFKLADGGVVLADETFYFGGPTGAGEAAEFVRDNWDETFDIDAGGPSPEYPPLIFDA